jgi:hypothetical protein
MRRVNLLKLRCDICIGPTLLCEPREFRQYDLATGWTTLFRFSANRMLFPLFHFVRYEPGGSPTSYPVVMEVEIFTPKLKRVGRDANRSSIDCSD